MAYGNLQAGVNLGPLFGAISPDANTRLLDRLLAIDGRLAQLAAEATAHVGVVYQPVQLGLFVRSADAEIAGGPSGAAGDIWFEVGFTWEKATGTWIAPPWTVESRLVVFCKDAPEPRGAANTHDLVHLAETADTPMAALDVLERHIGAIAEELSRQPPTAILALRHTDLP
jgi:hypothetical protein